MFVGESTALARDGGPRSGVHEGVVAARTRARDKFGGDVGMHLDGRRERPGDDHVICQISPPCSKGCVFLPGQR